MHSAFLLAFAQRLKRGAQSAKRMGFFRRKKKEGLRGLKRERQKLSGGQTGKKMAEVRKRRGEPGGLFGKKRRMIATIPRKKKTDPAPARKKEGGGRVRPEGEASTFDRRGRGRGKAAFVLYPEKRGEKVGMRTGMNVEGKESVRVLRKKVKHGNCRRRGKETELPEILGGKTRPATREKGALQLYRGERLSTIEKSSPHAGEGENS